MIHKGPQNKERSIDCHGPEGNAFAIMGNAKMWCRQLSQVDPVKYNWKLIEAKMTSGDYTNLVRVLEEYFGDYVTIYNAPEDL
jgi:hypothetical protein